MSQETNTQTNTDERSDEIAKLGGRLVRFFYVNDLKIVNFARK